MAVPAVRSKSEIWSDILNAEAQGDPVRTMTHVCDFLRAHPDESFFSVERRLRVQNRLTHLFARSLEEHAGEFGALPRGVAVLDPRTMEKRTYVVRVLLACYPDLAPKIRAFGANQAQNLERLKDAGISILKLN